MSEDRSPNASKEDMQMVIDLLRVRGDSLRTVADALRTTLNDIQKQIDQIEHDIAPVMQKIKELDTQLGIDKSARIANAVLVARRMLGQRGESMSDEEVLKAVGQLNEQ